MATFIILNIIHKWNISSSYPCPETVMSLYLIQNLINSHVFISIHVANISGSHTSYYIRWFYPIRWQWSTSMDHTHTYITSDGFILNIGNDIHQWITHIYMHTHQMVLSYTLAMICIYGSHTHTSYQIVLSYMLVMICINGSHTHITSYGFILHIGNDLHLWITHITSDGFILHIDNDLHQWITHTHQMVWSYTWSMTCISDYHPHTGSDGFILHDGIDAFS